MTTFQISKFIHDHIKPLLTLRLRMAMLKPMSYVSDGETLTPIEQDPTYAEQQLDQLISDQIDYCCRHLRVDLRGERP